MGNYISEINLTLSFSHLVKKLTISNPFPIYGNSSAVQIIIVFRMNIIDYTEMTRLNDSWSSTLSAFFLFYARSLLFNHCLFFFHAKIHHLMDALIFSTRTNKNAVLWLMKKVPHAAIVEKSSLQKKFFLISSEFLSMTLNSEFYI